MTARRRLLFCSYHSYLNPASGAAQSTRDLLALLAANGWECAVLSGPELDSPDGTASVQGLFRANNIAFKYRPGAVAGTLCTLYHGVLDGVALHSFVPNNGPHPRPLSPTGRGESPTGRQPPSKEAGTAFLALFDMVHRRFQPDILVSYGGHGFMFPLFRRARKQGVKVVFSLRNFAYTRAELFHEVDAVLVPSRAAQAHYRRTLGLESTPIPGPFNFERVSCSAVAGRYLTFVNPQPVKGTFWFARIAYELNRRRPDIRLLVVEGRGRADWLRLCDLDLSGLTNIDRMPNVSDPRQFYRVSRAMLMPSLWQEAFGRVAVEAAINRIPTLASNRGGLPEALGGAGFLFDIPAQYTPDCRRAPTTDEVAPWLEVIERLWDDETFYRQESERCRAAAEVWRPERMLPRFEEFFIFNVPARPHQPR
jgi:glycosyltransferase involved in cell wall biosynthesis